LQYKILKEWRLDFMPFFPIALGFAIETQVFFLGVLKQDRYIMVRKFFPYPSLYIFAIPRSSSLYTLANPCKYLQVLRLARFTYLYCKCLVADGERILHAHERYHILTVLYPSSQQAIGHTGSVHVYIGEDPGMERMARGEKIQAENETRRQFFYDHC
jgi:hypothetical protein